MADSFDSSIGKSADHNLEKFKSFMFLLKKDAVLDAFGLEHGETVSRQSLKDQYESVLRVSFLHETYLKGSSFTKKRLNAEFKEIDSKIRSKKDTNQDVLILYLSSHGVNTSDDDSKFPQILFRDDRIQLENIHNTAKEIGFDKTIIIAQSCNNVNNSFSERNQDHLNYKYFNVSQDQFPISTTLDLTMGETFNKKGFERILRLFDRHSGRTVLVSSTKKGQVSYARGDGLGSYFTNSLFFIMSEIYNKGYVYVDISKHDFRYNASLLSWNKIISLADSERNSRLNNEEKQVVNFITENNKISGFKSRLTSVRKKKYRYHFGGYFGYAIPTSSFTTNKEPKELNLESNFGVNSRGSVDINGIMKAGLTVRPTYWIRLGFGYSRTLPRIKVLDSLERDYHGGEFWLAFRTFRIFDTKVGANYLINTEISNSSTLKGALIGLNIRPLIARRIQLGVEANIFQFSSNEQFGNFKFSSQDLNGFSNLDSNELIWMIGVTMNFHLL